MRENKMLQWAAERKALDDEVKRLRDEMRKIDRKLIKAMQEREIDSVVGAGMKMTLVQPQSVSYDLKAAQKVLSAKLFKAVTKQSIDRQALEYQVSKGNIEPDTLETFATLEERTPYLRVSQVSDPGEDDGV